MSASRATFKFNLMSRQTSGTRKRDTDLLHELNDGIRKELRTRVAELLERDEARIRVPQDTVAIPMFTQISPQREMVRKDGKRGSAHALLRDTGPARYA